MVVVVVVVPLQHQLDLAPLVRRSPLRLGTLARPCPELLVVYLVSHRAPDGRAHCGQRMFVSFRSPSTADGFAMVRWRLGALCGSEYGAQDRPAEWQVADQHGNAHPCDIPEEEH